MLFGVKFSIITPSFNQGRFLRDCIESVRAQQGVEAEHIVVDACSTDATVAILREYPHLSWVSEPDWGQTDAINKGFLRATGDWVMWLNADDFLLPCALRQVAEFAGPRPQADVIYGDCDFVDATGQTVGQKREGDFSFWMLLFYGTYIPSTATFFHRRILEAGQLLNPSYKVNMDLEYYLRLADSGRQFLHLPEVLGCFRWHSSNVSTVHRATAVSEFRYLQRDYLQHRRCRWLACAPIPQGMHAVFRAFRLGRRLWRAACRPRSELRGNQLGWWHRPPAT